MDSGWTAGFLRTIIMCLAQASVKLHVEELAAHFQKHFLKRLF